jgi:V/A-type H+-transporting ATPase subunit I
MQTKMSRVEVIGPRWQYGHVLEELQSWGRLHIDDMFYEDSIPIRKIELKSQEQEEKAHRKELQKFLTDLINHAPHETEALPLEKAKECAWMPLGDALSYTRRLFSELQSLLQRKKAIADELGVLKEYGLLVHALLPTLPRRFPRGWEFIGVIIRGEQKGILTPLRNELEKITGPGCCVLSAFLRKGGTVALIGFVKKYGEQVRDLLQSKDLNELQLPTDLKDKPLHEAFRLIDERIERLPREAKALEEEIRKFFQRHILTIRDLEAANQDRLSQLEVTHQSAQTRYTFLIQGWLPRKELKNLRKFITSRFNGNIVVNELLVPEDKAERVPVQLKNPRPLTVFERLVSFFSLPQYGTVDPTPHIAFFFPLFFGFVMGDVGHGLVLMAMGAGLFVAMRKRHTLLADLGLITIILGVVSAGFGAAFGEFFGVQPWFHPLIPALARGHLHHENSKVVMNYLLLSLAFGVVQVSLGLILGIYTCFRTRHTRHALEGVAKLGVLAGALILIGRLTHFLPPLFLYIGGGVLAASIPAWGFLGGGLALIEITALFTNILSYIRLMALGMASVAFAMIASSFKEQAANPFIGLGIFIGVHAFNLALHIFTPTIQALRLHYVEFFPKFFNPGGRPYEPFTKVERRQEVMTTLLLTAVGFLLAFLTDSLSYAQEALETMQVPVAPEAAKPSPERIKVIAAAAAVGVAALATGFAQARIGAAGAGSLTEKPGLLPAMLVLMVIPETIIILGFVIAIMILFR